jgi:hypothetical protein
MLHATLELARRVDRAEIEFCALAGSGAFVSAGRFETQPQGVEMIDVAGGRALFSRPGSPLNKVLGLGLQGPVTDKDLDLIEAFYRAHHAPTQIELCPLAYGDVAARLCLRGYTLEAFENELAMVIGPAKAGPYENVAGPYNNDVVVGAGLNRPEITLTTPDQDDLWLRIVAEGFVAFEPLVGGMPEGKALTTEQMIEMMSQFGHPNIRRYLAWVDGTPAGAGAAWAHEGVLGIFGTSTLPQFRRRGVQAAVTIRAVRDAEGTADLAIATTAPGSTSQRTFERLGFSVIYTRAVFVRS